MEEKIEPIKPGEVSMLKKKLLPNFVIESFNELIAENYLNRRSYFTVDDVVQRIMSKTDNSKTEIYGNKWLDVEPIYESAGWKVKYDQPGYCESYPSTFEFSHK